VSVTVPARTYDLTFDRGYAAATVPPDTGPITTAPTTTTPDPGVVTVPPTSTPPPAVPVATLIGVLLPTDQVSAYASATPEFDAHGWALPATGPFWAGQVALQLRAGSSDPAAADGGGHGPYQPNADQRGDLYAPVDCGIVDGTLIQAQRPFGDVWFICSQVRAVIDPTGTGNLNCLVATVSSVDDWPDTTEPPNA